LPHFKLLLCIVAQTGCCDISVYEKRRALTNKDLPR
jgi:hypothetical protein